MRQESKIEIRRKARIIRGVTNLLVNDVSYICSDADDFDLVALRESIPEFKDTIEKLIDHVAELEYMVYLSTQREPCRE